MLLTNHINNKARFWAKVECNKEEVI